MICFIKNKYMCGLKVNFNQPILYIMRDKYKYKYEIFTKEVTLDIIIAIAFF